MRLASFRRQLFQNALDTDNLLASLGRWPAWLLSCYTGRERIARFKTGGLRMKLIPRLTGFGTTSIFIKRDNYEPELRLIERFIRPDSVVLDIGASFGVFALFMAHYVGAQGKVYAFEPGRLSFEQLTANIAMNGAVGARISAFDVAATDTPAALKLYRIGDAPVTASMGGADGTAFDQVRGEPVSALVPAADHGRVSFIKIDVEGYERTALEGARAIIEASHPVIMFEVSASALSRQGLTPADIFTYLRAYGYAFHIFDSGHELRRLSGPEEGNIFAVPEGGAKD